MSITDGGRCCYPLLRHLRGRRGPLLPRPQKVPSFTHDPSPYLLLVLRPHRYGLHAQCWPTLRLAPPPWSLRVGHVSLSGTVPLDLLLPRRTSSTHLIPLRLRRTQWILWRPLRVRTPQDGRCRWSRGLALALHH